MSEIFAFHSDAFDVNEAFERYCRLYAFGTDVERMTTPFFAHVRSWRLERTLLFERHYGGARHRRLERISRDGFDHFVLHHVVTGELIGGSPGATRRLGPGQTLVLDTCAPMESMANDVRLITVSLAREAMRASAGQLDDLHGHCIGVREGALLAALLRSLVAEADHLPASAHATVTRSLLDLLSIALDPRGTGPRSDFRRLEFARHESVRRLIEANLGDANFSVQDIIEATGISRASLYRLFSAQGGVARFIQSRRLQHLRERLDDRRCDALSLAELAPRCGFANESHASRSFKQAFAISPGAYRSASIKDASYPTVDLMAQRWAHSLDELK